MIKSYRIILAICVISLLAAPAFAAGKGQPAIYDLTRVEASEHPSGRAVTVLSYDFGESPVDYIFDGVIFGDQGILPAGSRVVGFGFNDLEVEIYHNDGASFANWASEAWLGFSFVDPINGPDFVGLSPFAGVNEGPGVFGPIAGHFALDPDDWPLPTEDPFTFYARALWNDGTGLPAGTFFAGTVFVEIEEDVVATDAASLTAVKALFQ
jgi:hypothetical protein